jgi:alkylation response protein AidB-like acyl-CoA dehydrogenase/acyl-CoA synthetase (AMP-forming)/AMP-acid ligase II/acyl carrier protein
VTAPATLVDLLVERAAEEPARGGYTFSTSSAASTSAAPDDGAGPVEESLDFARLDARARGLAVRLAERAEPGDRALLLFPPGLEFPVALFACLHAGVLAVPVPPPEPARLARTLPRVTTVVRDCRPRLALTTREGLELLQPLIAEEPELQAMAWLAVDPDDEARAADWRLRQPEADDVAYLQYTSGSTSRPKGVEVRHRDLIANSEAIRRAWGYDGESRAVMWVPNFHDDGLVHGIVQPLYTGFASVLMSPADVVRRPGDWLGAISRHRGTHAGGPNFIYALAHRKVDVTELPGLDLASWRVAYNAAEPVRADTLRGFVDRFAPHGFSADAFHPSFGLAEATLLVTTGHGEGALPVRALGADELERQGRAVPVSGDSPAGPGAVREVVSCGRPVHATRVEVVDPETRRALAEGSVGEIWVASDSIPGRYWERPEATAETFGARLAGDEDDARGFLRTGDLGFLLDGELHVTGRLKDLIIVRGRNIHPHDVERTVEDCHATFRPGCGAAFALDDGEDERLVVVQEVRDPRAVDLDALVDATTRAVAESHDVRLHTLVLLPPGALPKTSSGKVQRQACRLALVDDGLPVVARWESPVGRSRRPAEGPGALADGTTDADPVEPLLAWLRDYARRRLDSLQMDERRTIPPHVVLDFGNRGLLGLQASRRHGGLGLSHRQLVRVIAQLGAIDTTLAVFVIGHNGLGLRPVLRFARPSLRDRLLPELASGRRLTAFALSEPGAGSNPLALAGRAVEREEGGWRIDGTKMWIGSASWAGSLNVFAQMVDREGSPRGITGFVVPQDAPGLRPGREALTMGLKGMVQSELHLDGVEVDEESLLGEPGGGLDVARDAIGFTRLCLGAAARGGVERCLQLILRYAGRRTVGTGRLLDNPATLARLADLSARLEALDALCDWIASDLDAGREVAEPVLGVAKTFGGELFWEAADTAVQLLGGRGYVETNGAARMLRDARVFRIFEGPDEALRMHLGALVERGDDRLATLLPSAVGEALARAVEACRSRLDDGAPGAFDRPAAARWGHLLLGRAAERGVLLAALEVTGGSETDTATVWARRAFDDALTAVREGTAAEALLDDRTAVVERAERLAARAGSVDQRAAGVDWQTDPLLHPEAPGAPGEAPAEVPAPAPVPTPTATDGPGAERIEEWLIGWLADELGVDDDAIDPRRPFAAHGLDSVVGVRMAERLGAWLGRGLDVTLAWEYPTLEALAHFLASGPSAPSGPVTGGTAPAAPAAPATPATDRDDALARVLARLEGGGDE